MNINKIIRSLALFVAVLGVAQLSAQPLTKLNKGLPCINKKFQVHAHVILDSLGVAQSTAEALQSAFAEVNEAFAPICVSFEVCSTDTINNYEFDSIATFPESEEMKNLFHLENRINFYLATELMPGVAGFATLCGVKQMNNGAVFLKGIGAGTIIHELGHLFGLEHTFEGSGIELVNGSNCETEGDKICDTPADPYVNGEDFSQYINLETCEFISIKRDSMNQFYQPDVGNFMSYYPCACGFTRGQYIKMAEQFLISDPKMW